MHQVKNKRQVVYISNVDLAHPLQDAFEGITHSLVVWNMKITARGGLGICGLNKP